jgi:diguanylate cyclase (GGDEF)-like protein
MKRTSELKIERNNPLSRLRTEGDRMKKSNKDLRELIKKLEESNRALLKQNRKLSKLALKDPHTGVYNRRYLQEMLEKELSLAKRHSQSLSVIIMDIDYFKAINDVYGHACGDLVLKQFTRTLKKAIRRYDTIFRFGGEEFVIISPRTDRATGVILGKRLLRTIHQHRFGYKGNVIKLKVSIGVASYPEDGLMVRGFDLVYLADRVLSKVKEYGGNKVYSMEDSEKMEKQVPAKNGADAGMELLKKKVHRLSQRANQSLIEAVFALAKTIGLKDRYSDTFSKRTTDYAVEIATLLKVPKTEIEHIRKAAILHDIGKVGIHEEILLKKSKLTDKEFELMKQHPQLSTDIIRPLHFLKGTIPFILYHHERWDGKGYPNGLKGNEIPIGARIIAIVDAYRSLTANRPYRKAYARNEAMKILEKESGTKFDPRVTSVFLEVLGR